MKELYKLSNIVQQYNGRTVLELDHFSVSEGAIVGLAGHNGSGKSTLMRMLAFLENPVSGEIYYDGKKVELSGTDLRREVTMLTQEPYLLKRSVGRNVAYGLELRGESCIESKVRDSLTQVGLEPDLFMSRQWFELSGGEAQRVALAARLAIMPKVLLLDEPTASLDRESTLLIHEAAVNARKENGTTLVIVSHDHHWLEEVSDTIFRFAGGRLDY
ncbi:ABC transporter ATP-binding protein [Maridesulfovibrio hydrothermalis]|uniref:ABC transporter related n=1 Tax=Maridesulfovibrio hydrothermalis AM13 = DSM 14728 TaxID=1121451 RepID=L0RGM0_9BACT|nr:ABC transporter ATP-binding protein [Maridesulfovibrio hydrothermalis]CCO25365.1 ABC transporter related [Maridesulfovibrio hydrothermalis AM13 = DSM 14728]